MHYKKTSALTLARTKEKNQKRKKKKKRIVFRQKHRPRLESRVRPVREAGQRLATATATITAGAPAAATAPVARPPPPRPARPPRPRRQHRVRAECFAPRSSRAAERVRRYGRRDGRGHRARRRPRVRGMPLRVSRETWCRCRRRHLGLRLLLRRDVADGRGRGVRGVRG